MNLHQLCIDSLNTEVTKALMCGKRLNPSQIKDFIITFGALHLFVVSGAHLYLWKNVLLFFKLPKKALKCALFILLFNCDFSAPILRAFVQIELTCQRKIFIPKNSSAFLALIICSPIAHLKSELFSLTLSFIFSSIMISTTQNKKLQQLSITALAIPVFSSVLGLPHYSSFIIAPILTVLITFLMPLSFLSLFSNYLEYTSTKVWWHLESTLNYVHTFYNSPLKPMADFKTASILMALFYGLILNLIIYSLGVLWKRKSFSLYYS